MSSSRITFYDTKFEAPYTWSQERSQNPKIRNKKVWVLSHIRHIFILVRGTLMTPCVRGQLKVNLKFDGTKRKTYSMVQEEILTRYLKTQNQFMVLISW